MKQAMTIFNRLTEVEKIQIRAAQNINRIEWLANTQHLSDMPLETFDERVSTLVEVQALCFLDFKTKSQNADFTGVTWKY